ncbi:MAG TPA: hypothetical protein VM841_12870 [Actinomycetota bacterium]|nr:hypothetical protein [Actinomycetota bacterium]
MTTQTESRRVAVLIGGGAALAFLGLLLPWVSVQLSIGAESTSLSQSGLATDDGKVILIIAVLLGLIAAPFFTGRIRRVLIAGIVALLLSTVVTLVGFADINDIRSRGDETEAVSATVGFGLYVTTAGGLVALMGSFMAIRGRRTLGEAAAPGGDDDAIPPAPPAPPPAETPTLPSEQPPPPPPAP